MPDRPLRPGAEAADAALARRLMAEAATAALAVVDSDGLPYIALTAPALAADGATLALASDLAAHGRALRDDGRTSLLFQGEVDPANPLQTARLTVKGRAEAARPEDRAAFLARRPEAALYIDFGDMRLYRIAPTSAQLVAGFGRAVALTPADLSGGL